MVNDDDKCIDLNFTGSSFNTGTDAPFDYTDTIYVDWGDGTALMEYVGGQLSHIYSVSDNYNIKIYGNITTLKARCFSECAGLTSIILPDNITSIGSMCFWHCTNLTNIIMSNNITMLGGNCFNMCSNLTSITIPNNVTGIGTMCFWGCSKLTEIILEWDTSSEILTYNSDWIGSCSSFEHFFIPQNTESLYEEKGYPLDKLYNPIISKVIKISDVYAKKTDVDNTYAKKTDVDAQNNNIDYILNILGSIIKQNSDLINISHDVNNFPNYKIIIQSNITNLYYEIYADRVNRLLGSGYTSSTNEVIAVGWPTYEHAKVIIKWPYTNEILKEQGFDTSV